MLIQSNLDKAFWVEEVQYLTYTRNRSPTKLLKITPFEAWFDKQPTVGHLQPFRTKAYVHVNKPKQKSKLDARAHTGIFVGYALNCRAFRIAIKTNNTFKIVESSDVKFSSRQLNIIGQNQETPKLNIKTANQFNPLTIETTISQNSSSDAEDEINHQANLEGQDEENEIFYSDQENMTNSESNDDQQEPHQQPENQNSRPVRYSDITSQNIISNQRSTRSGKSFANQKGSN